VKDKLDNIGEETEKYILRDNNLLAIKYSLEFIINKRTDSPTHRILTSVFSEKRLSFILNYAIACVSEETGKQKRTKRYPHMFVTKAIVTNLDSSKNKGTILHTKFSNPGLNGYSDPYYTTHSEA
ncbi:MAG: hypothetical protein ABWZ79_12480, partial [Pedobacter agri]